MNDLEWLARNVHEWGCEHAVKELEYAIDRSLGECVFIDGDSCICKEEWLQKRAELQNKPSWDDAPDWANWLSQDRDGEWSWRKNKPIDQTSSFYSSKGGIKYARIGEVLGNWQDTLEERPKKASDAPVKDSMDKFIADLSTQGEPSLSATYHFDEAEKHLNSAINQIKEARSIAEDAITRIDRVLGNKE